MKNEAERLVEGFSDFNDEVWHCDPPSMQKDNQNNAELGIPNRMKSDTL